MVEPARRDERGRFLPAGQNGGGDEDDFTPAGANKAAESADRFRAFLKSQSALNARRRGASAADDVDVQDAFKSLLDRRPRPLTVDVSCEVGLVASGALISYGVTLLTAVIPVPGPGWVLVLAGCFVGLFSAILKHIDIR